MTATILVVDDDAAFRDLVSDVLAAEGHQVVPLADGESALRRIAQHDVDLVVSDQRMPGIDGIELTRRLRALADPPAILLMTAYGTIPQAVEAVRLGADDYLTKPLDSLDTLRLAVRRALGRRRDRPGPTSGDFLTRDATVLEVLALADRAAQTDSTVLILGESGTGKELLARRLHQRSSRAGGPFVAVNSAALPESLAESELFGHERGAYTGATSQYLGRFEQADRGSLFLDEVGELSGPIQAKLLRALEERTIERVGGSRRIVVDLRLIAATHRDLRADVATGRFREDLFYRLNVVTLSLPPLRERPLDVPMLAEALLDQLASRLGSPRRELSSEVREVLVAYSWPGNVRELRNAMERALIAATGEAIEVADLPPLSERPAEPRDGVGAAPQSLREQERRAILEALERTGGHRERAAAALGISVRTLYNRLRELRIR